MLGALLVVSGAMVVFRYRLALLERLAFRLADREPPPWSSFYMDASFVLFVAMAWWMK